MCDNTKVYDTIKVEKETMDASREEWKTNHANWNYTSMPLTSMVSSSWLSLPSRVSMTTKTHGLNDVTNVEDVNNCHSNQFYHNISNTSWRKMQSKWFYLRPPWSSPPDCPCRPHCRRPPTNMSLLLSSIYQKYKNNFDVNQYHHSISHPTWRKFQQKWYILN